MRAWDQPGEPIAGAPLSATPNVNYPRILVKSLQDGHTSGSIGPHDLRRLDEDPTHSSSWSQQSCMIAGSCGRPLGNHTIAAQWLSTIARKSGATSRAQIFHGRIVVYLSCRAGVYPGMA